MTDEELYNEAVDITRFKKYISVSMAQRGLRVGYMTASLIINKMIDNKIIESERRHITLLDNSEVFGFAYIPEYVQAAAPGTGDE